MATREARGLIDAFKQAYGEGREDWNRAYRTERSEGGKSEDASRITEMTGSYPTGIRVMEALEPVLPKNLKPDQRKVQVREDLGIGRQPAGNGRRTGQMLGTLAADLTQDNTRSFYWLGNAIQALGSIGQEALLEKFAPQLFASTVQNRPGTNTPMTMKSDKALAQKMGLLDPTGKPTRGVRINDGGQIAKRNFDPGDKAALLIPSGLAINAGIGLMSPMGGAEGYEAVIPDEDNKKQSANPVLEVATKYLMGRTGNLLPYDEFSKERPDVSRGEYNAYKAFKYDKDVDLNPLDDGQMTLPGAAAKFTADGIHGPEVQFFGKSLPMTTGAIPLVSALAATTYGATRKKPIARGLQYGLAGYAGGTAAGAIAEQIRRRAGSVSNDQLEGEQL